MASSRGTSNGADWRDVTGNIVAFEAINGVQVVVSLTTADYHGRADLLLQLTAFNPDPTLSEAVALGSVSLTTSSLRLRTLEAALIHGLYMLDGVLAKGEFAKVLDG